jgi:hypothetical protein
MALIGFKNKKKEGLMCFKSWMEPHSKGGLLPLRLNHIFQDQTEWGFISRLEWDFRQKNSYIIAL